MRLHAAVSILLLTDCRTASTAEAAGIVVGCGTDLAIPSHPERLGNDRRHLSRSMNEWLATVSLILVVLAVVPSMAHALELPGKLRLEHDAYMTIQPIYYPGFTFAGFAEPVAIVVTAILAAVTRGTPLFGPALIALLAMTAAHAIYWLVTHPVNKLWLRETKVGRPGRRFFEASGGAEGDWTRLRDRWESSHVIRAILIFAAFLALAIGS